VQRTVIERLPQMRARTPSDPRFQPAAHDVRPARRHVMTDNRAAPERRHPV
jgi:hypothetical protein